VNETASFGGGVSAFSTTDVPSPALGLLGVGLIAAAGAVFVEARTVLIALGATGVFAGVLTYFSHQSGSLRRV